MFGEKKRKVGVDCTKALGERVAAFLRRRHPIKTAASVAGDIGVAAGTVAKWLEGAATPGGLAILKLIDFYGAEFIAAVWPRPAGFLVEAAARARRERVASERAALVRELAALDAELDGLGIDR